MEINKEFKVKENKGLLIICGVPVLAAFYLTSTLSSLGEALFLIVVSVEGAL
jgi:hypothetical protein